MILFSTALKRDSPGNVQKEKRDTGRCVLVSYP